MLPWYPVWQFSYSNARTKWLWQGLMNLLYIFSIYKGNNKITRAQYLPFLLTVYMWFVTESSCICRWACGPNRQFRLEFFSPQDDLVFALHRTCCRCDWCCCLDCFMCVHKTYVVDCLGRTLGSVKQRLALVFTPFD